MPGVSDLILRLLTALWNKDPTPTSPYRLKFAEIVDLAPNIVSGTTEPWLWDIAKKKEFLANLVPKYSAIFGSEVIVNNAPQLLKSDVLDIPTVYNDPSASPDAEHDFIISLVQEGVVTEIVTTNWDPLLERAEEAARGPNRSMIKIIACSEDFHTPANNTIAELAKIHGCARGCCANPAKYKDYFIVTTLDIARWTAHPKFQGFRDKTRALLTGLRSLFVGLSAQDFNLLQRIFEANQNTIAFDATGPRLAFAPTLSDSEKTAIKGTYGEDVYSENFTDIMRTAHIKLYGKPLFGALYLLTLFTKARVMVSRVGAPLTTIHTDLLNEAIASAEALLSQRFDTIVDHDAQWRQLSSEHRRISITQLSIRRSEAR